MTEQEMSELLEQMKTQVQGMVGERSDFESIWHAAVDQYMDWVRATEGKISSLGLTLALLENLSHAYDFDLRADQGITNLALAEAPPVEAEFVKTGCMGEAITFRVTDRQITPTFGVLLFLENEDGESSIEEIYE